MHSIVTVSSTYIINILISTQAMKIVLYYLEKETFGSKDSITLYSFVNNEDLIIICFVILNEYI